MADVETTLAVRRFLGPCYIIKKLLHKRVSSVAPHGKMLPASEEFRTFERPVWNIPHVDQILRSLLKFSPAASKLMFFLH